jgi:hypothetical protein
LWDRPQGRLSAVTGRRIQFLLLKPSGH